jgi:hypothetical protein
LSNLRMEAARSVELPCQLQSCTVYLVSTQYVGARTSISCRHLWCIAFHHGMHSSWQNQDKVPSNEDDSSW